MSNDAAANDGVAAVTEALQATSIEEQGLKVFVGNLSFSTTEEQLKETFGKHGSLKDAQIILRGKRSLGYGFVTYDTKEDASKAVGALDKTDLSGRTINVEIAKPPPGAPGGSVPKAAARAAKKAATTNGENGAVGTAETAAATTGGGKARKPRKKRGGEVSTDLPVAPPVMAADDTAAPVVDASAPSGPRKARRGGKGRGTAPVDGEAAPAGRKRAPRTRVGPPTGEPSKTQLFVANLPFSLTDDGLKAAFGAYKISSVNLPRHKYGFLAGRTKGFGFIYFENEADQQRALTEMQGKEIEGRPMQVKVAIEAEEGAAPEDGTAAEAEAPVAAEPVA